MNKKSKIKYVASLAVLAVTSLAMATVYGVCMYLYHDPQTQLTEGELHTVIMALAVPVFGILGLICAYPLKGGTFITYDSEGRSDTFNRIVCALGALSSAGIFASYFLSDRADPLRSLMLQDRNTAYYCHILCVVLSLCTALVLISFVFSKDGAYMPVRQLPLLGFGIFYLIRLHTDMSVMLMSTRRMITVLAVSMLLLFITAKIRILCGKEAGKYYIVSGYLAVGTLTLSGLGGIIPNALFAFSDGLQLYFYVFELVMALYVFAELSKRARGSGR